MNLDVIDGGAVADTLERDTVQFVFRCEARTCVLDGDIFQRTGIVVGFVAAEETGGAFTGLFAIRGAAGRGGQRAGVDRCETVDHEAAPLSGGRFGRDGRTGLLVVHLGARGKADRIGGRTDSLDLRAAGDDQVVVGRRCGTGSGSAEEAHAFTDGQRGSRAAALGVRTDEDRAAKGDRGVGRDRDVARDDGRTARGTEDADLRVGKAVSGDGGEFSWKSSPWGSPRSERG